MPVAARSRLVSNHERPARGEPVEPRAKRPSFDGLRTSGCSNPLAEALSKDQPPLRERVT
jgi:hypothetical protein